MLTTCGRHLQLGHHHRSTHCSHPIPVHFFLSRDLEEHGFFSTGGDDPGFAGLFLAPPLVSFEGTFGGLDLIIFFPVDLGVSFVLQMFIHL